MCSGTDFLAGGVSVIAPIVVSWARLLLGDDDDDVEAAATSATAPPAAPVVNVVEGVLEGVGEYGMDF